MRYFSVCSGIEAATVGWHRMGWEPVAFSEIEPFPAAVLKHRYPNVPNLGDMTKINGGDYRGARDFQTITPESPGAENQPSPARTARATRRWATVWPCRACASSGGGLSCTESLDTPPGL